MKKFILLSFLLVNVLTFSQLTVNNSMTPQQLVQNILAGTGVQVSNVTFNGESTAIGLFDGVNTNLSFPAGIILTSGDIAGAPGPNNDSDLIGAASTDHGGTGDLDLDDISSPQTTNDAAVLEFDFIPVSDTVKFNYIFASEEYLEYVGTIWNDVFGFFISGPGINGPFSNNAENIAIVPGTTDYVTISNINDGNNSAFYVDNGDGSTSPFDTDSAYIRYDGYTVSLQAISAVQCGQTYHIKMVIADVADGSLDSGVFLEAGSLSSTEIDFIFAAVDGSTEFYEGCTEAEFVFTRPSDQTNAELTLGLTVSGTSTAGTDYTSLLDSVHFNIGADSVFVPFATFSDNIIEGDETVTISANVITICGDTVQITKTITIKDPIHIDSIATTPSLSCANTGNAQAFISNSNGVVNFTWNGPGASGPVVGNTITTNNLAPGWYYLEVTDVFCEDKDSVLVDMIPAPDAELSAGPITSPAPVTVTFTNSSQNADSFEWIFGNGDTLLVSDTGDQSSLYPENTTYTVILVAFQQQCSDTARITIEAISVPSVFEPNIITVNGDSLNEYFTLWPQNFTSFDYIIFNRWGGVMFEGNLLTPKWHAITEDNKEAEEGVYFYKYTGVGLNGETKTGQGFFHIQK